MIVPCEKCHTLYDDENRWTICPHGPLWAGPGQYCREHDLVNCKLPHEEVYMAKRNQIRVAFGAILFLLAAAFFVWEELR